MIAFHSAGWPNDIHKSRESEFFVYGKYCVVIRLLVWNHYSILYIAISWLSYNNMLDLGAVNINFVELYRS